ncbi:MAG: Ribosome-binding factor A [Parcubacteria group bacterium Greene0416_79]|nr:MAG: Ribosome-binding factor A [Parcubacteria group bacterium Greene0416_79]
MNKIKSEKIKESLKHLAAEFLRRESNRQSLITVTDVMLKDRGARAVMLCTVLPEEQEGTALAFLKRRRGGMRRYISEHLRIQHLLGTPPEQN